MSTPEVRGLTSGDAGLAREISAAAARLQAPADPAAVQHVQVAIDAHDIGNVRPFWQAVPGYAVASDGGEAGEVELRARGGEHGRDVLGLTGCHAGEAGAGGVAGRRLQALRCTRCAASIHQTLISGEYDIRWRRLVHSPAWLGPTHDRGASVRRLDALDRLVRQNLASASGLR